MKEDAEKKEEEAKQQQDVTDSKEDMTENQEAMVIRYVLAHVFIVFTDDSFYSLFHLL